MIFSWKIFKLFVNYPHKFYLLNIFLLYNSKVINIMAKKNKSSKKKKHIRGIQSITIPSQIIKARNYPIHSCYANSEWKDRGITTVFITRAKPDGLFIAGIYLIDIWCLGVKDAFYQINISEHQLEEIIHKNPNEPLIQVSSDFAHSLIYGAVRYAEKLGFKPHRDFKMASHSILLALMNLNRRKR